ncbi:MAG: phosphonate C-P lyase system protein PhnG [Halanaerobiaceae bacterium]
MDYLEVIKIFSNMDLEKLDSIREKVRMKYSISLIKPVDTSLVMMGTKDSVQFTSFYLGEVLISQCVVSVGNYYGYGYIMGENLQKAYNLAVIDAIWCRDSELTTEIEELLTEEKDRQENILKKEYEILEKTRVQFESMEEVPE